MLQAALLSPESWAVSAEQAPSPYGIQWIPSQVQARVSCLHCKSFAIQWDGLPLMPLRIGISLDRDRISLSMSTVLCTKVINIVYTGGSYWQQAQIHIIKSVAWKLDWAKPLRRRLNHLRHQPPWGILRVQNPVQFPSCLGHCFFPSISAPVSQTSHPCSGGAFHT